MKRYISGLIILTVVGATLAAPVHKFLNEESTSSKGVISREMYHRHNPRILYLGCDYFALPNYRIEAYHDDELVLLNLFDPPKNDITRIRYSSFFKPSASGTWEKTETLKLTEGFHTSVAYDSILIGKTVITAGIQYKLGNSELTQSLPVVWVGSDDIKPLPAPKGLDLQEYALIPVKMNEEFIAGWSWPLSAASETQCMFASERNASIKRPYLVLWQKSQTTGEYDLKKNITAEDVTELIDLGKQGELLYLANTQEGVKTFFTPSDSDHSIQLSQERIPLELFYSDSSRTTPDYLLTYENTDNKQSNSGKSYLFSLATGSEQLYSNSAPEGYYKTRPMRENHFSGKEGVRCYHTGRVYDSNPDTPSQPDFQQWSQWRTEYYQARQKGQEPDHLYLAPSYCVYQNDDGNMVFDEALNYMSNFDPSFNATLYFVSWLGGIQTFQRNSAGQPISFFSWNWPVDKGDTYFLKLQINATMPLDGPLQPEHNSL